MFDLHGRVALVTGASRGIGRAVAVALASRGAYVGVNYAGNEAAAEETLALVRAAGAEGELLRFDVRSGDAVREAVDGFAERRKGLHIAVANAGVAVDGLLLRVGDDDIDAVLATNVKGALYLARSSVRWMMKAKWGRFVAIGSVVGQMGNAGQSVYAASKAALDGLTRSIAREYGSRGVTANVVAPGFVETDMTAGLSDELKKRLRESAPAGRLGRPEDIAAAVLYLASNEAGYVTGQTLGVNGGLHM